MIFDWLRDRRRAEIAARPFPAGWDAYLEASVGPWGRWSEAERERLRRLVRVFAEEKSYEGCGGLVLTEEMRVSIAGQACLLIWGHDDHDLYAEVETILVYPSTVVPRRSGGGIFPRSEDDGLHPVLGEAHRGGPVILAWDATVRGAKDPHDGVNLVFHEFAHKLDMLTGRADGTPPLPNGASRAAWAEIFEAAFLRLRRDAERGRRTLLDPYGAVNEAEFFAVATELFFERGDAMRAEAPDLYDALRGFYRQETARVDAASDPGRDPHR